MSRGWLKHLVGIMQQTLTQRTAILTSGRFARDLFDRRLLM